LVCLACLLPIGFFGCTKSIHGRKKPPENPEVAAVMAYFAPLHEQTMAEVGVETAGEYVADRSRIVPLLEIYRKKLAAVSIEDCPSEFESAYARYTQTVEGLVHLLKRLPPSGGPADLHQEDMRQVGVVHRAMTKDLKRLQFMGEKYN
jgi:hypothetical protein